MPVFRQHEVLLVQAREWAAVFTRHHHVENDNPRIRLEDMASVVAWRRGLARSLALQGRGKKTGQAAQ